MTTTTMPVPPEATAENEATAAGFATSIGMQLDAAIGRLLTDGLSSTQLYILIVLVTVLISSLLLRNAPEFCTDDVDGIHKELAAARRASDPRSKQKKMKHGASSSRIHNSHGEPEPRWYIFRMFNYGMMVAFVASVVAFFIEFTAISNNTGTSISMLRYLLGWSVFLIYFFGFFGVTIVNDVEQSDAGDACDEQHHAAAVSASSSAEDTSVSAMTDPSVIQKTTDAACGLGCSVSTNDDTNPSCMATSSSKRSAPDNAAAAANAVNPLKSGVNIPDLSDEDIANLVLTNQMKDHELEKRLQDTHRAVVVRRLVMEAKLAQVLPPPTSRNAASTTGTTTGPPQVLANLPHTPSLDYARVHGANCEIVVGYVPIPVGLVGPLTVNGQDVYIPMATTEGCLVASTNRGAKAISNGGFGGATAEIMRDGITRAPCVRMESAQQAAQLKLWCEEPHNFALLKQAFESTTSFGKLRSCAPTVAGRNVYLRFTCFSGDAMGMNMVSKGCLAVIELLQKEFPSLQLVALSGNMCTDKKAAATNWLEGRGKSVVVEATIDKAVVRQTLKTTVQAIVETNLHKNLIGSAMAGTIGGFNAHASNIVTAIFLATGQDPAQNVESSNCITLLEETPEGDLWISCTMPSLEVGTVGGGTSLAAQAACLSAMGCKGGSTEEPGKNAQKLAQIIAAATMAGELSLLSALAANTLVQAHMKHNRKK